MEDNFPIHERSSRWESNNLGTIILLPVKGVGSEGMSDTQPLAKLILVETTHKSPLKDWFMSTEKHSAYRYRCTC